MNHTPSPWTAERGKQFIFAQNGYYVCMMNPGVNLNEKIANAQLIAAAPDLLRVCEEALAHITQNRVGSMVYLQMQQAIAKAKGEQCPQP